MKIHLDRIKCDGVIRYDERYTYVGYIVDISYVNFISVNCIVCLYIANLNHFISRVTKWRSSSKMGAISFSIVKEVENRSQWGSLKITEV